MTLTRRSFVAGSLAQRPARKTNVVMFMTDDHGAWTLGSYGCSEAHTPNIDRLAKDGAKFTRAYACTPVCSPSRMNYMTGSCPASTAFRITFFPRTASVPPPSGFWTAIPPTPKSSPATATSSACAANS